MVQQGDFSIAYLTGQPAHQDAAEQQVRGLLHDIVGAPIEIQR